MKWASFFLVILFLITSSCKKNDSKYPYAIKNFSKELRPYLSQIVSNGSVGVDYRSEMFVKDSASFDEIKKLANCEHPLLRAIALRALLTRDSANKNELILSHLTDTAFIVVESSNWRASFTGFDFSSVTDDMISHSNWKSFSEREKIIDSVIIKHNYLISAYEIADRLQPEEKYYSSLKEMILRLRDHKLLLKVIIALARFNKKEDITLLKEMIETYNQQYKFPAFVLEKSQDSIFFNYFDSLYVRWIKSEKQFQDNRAITWETYE